MLLVFHALLEPTTPTLASRLVLHVLHALLDNTLVSVHRLVVIVVLELTATPALLPVNQPSLRVLLGTEQIHPTIQLEEDILGMQVAAYELRKAAGEEDGRTTYADALEMRLGKMCDAIVSGAIVLDGAPISTTGILGWVLGGSRVQGPGSRCPDL